MSALYTAHKVSMKPGGLQYHYPESIVSLPQRRPILSLEFSSPHQKNKTSNLSHVSQEWPGTGKRQLRETVPRVGRKGCPGKLRK